jgi:hypothetical protein
MAGAKGIHICLIVPETAITANLKAKKNSPIKLEEKYFIPNISEGFYVNILTR